MCFVLLLMVLRHARWACASVTGLAFRSAAWEQVAHWAASVAFDSEEAVAYLKAVPKAFQKAYVHSTDDVASVEASLARGGGSV